MLNVTAGGNIYDCTKRNSRGEVGKVLKLLVNCTSYEAFFLSIGAKNLCFGFGIHAVA